ncbi:P27 family phage terminase small subunit [Streptomyces scabiei]|uniref:P27 family phage terminase small subunit n=1 Tax=Streptomyces scabiei TaxID=1930 RepID=UPI0029A975B1|nr:P27 family phage terminase small subunit [Streptomyces scabiei]MDX2538594.1 P27 family phage terminase small subunit [Streptomyces scabiei]MDX2799868.1 P27 family phage terminase small subunit [Streptomyces scabiei]MDX2855549.1 P27 family phage terminase small subunit [Streptomyces scabiei]MDX3278053.1 P27 family phage terminase small subunit [Streptomyces scabiei]MDX3828523.1 P27 family phage terminase small subunit [Streptomyces scabiei]
MAVPGRKPKPALQVVREGNPGHRPVREGAKVPPAEVVEPEWTELFPDVPVPEKPRAPAGADDEELKEYRREVAHWQRIKLASEAAAFSRDVAGREWSRVVPILIVAAGLSVVDRSTAVDYCVCVARLEWCERRLSVEGLISMGQRGPCRNPLTTIASQYRTQLKSYIGELGLSPSSRGRISPPEGGIDDDDGSVFD